MAVQGFQAWSRLSKFGGVDDVDDIKGHHPLVLDVEVIAKLGLGLGVGLGAGLLLRTLLTKMTLLVGGGVGEVGKLMLVRAGCAEKSL